MTNPTISSRVGQFRRSTILIAGLGSLFVLSGCNLFTQLQGQGGFATGCGDSASIVPVSGTQTVDSIRKITMERASSNPRKTVQANLTADFGRGPSGRKTRSDISVIAQTDGSFARLKVTAEASVPVADVLLQGDRFSMVSFREKRVFEGTNPERGSDRASFVPMARAMVQVLDPESALASRFARQPEPTLEKKAGVYALTFNRPDQRQEVWTLRQRDLMPIKLELREGLATTSEITVGGYKDASDRTGPVPTCASLLVDPGVDVGLKTGTVRRNVIIPAAARKQDRPAGYRVSSI